MLARIMNTDPLEDSRIAAIEGIGSLKAQDPRIYHVLIEGMEHEDPAIRLESYRSLKKITGKDVGNQPGAWRRELESKPKVAGSEKPTAGASDADPATTAGTPATTTGPPSTAAAMPAGRPAGPTSDRR